MSIIYSKEQDGTLNVLMTGKITRDPELKVTNKGNKTKFSVAYGKKKYMDCEVWSDSPAGELAGCLEKGDTVLLTGSHRSWEYNDKTYHSVDVDAIFPMTAPAPTPLDGSKSNSGAAEAQFEEIDVDEGELPF
jgi:single-stranded DNA-binding protein